jgi:hypothetical protein
VDRSPPPFFRELTAIPRRQITPDERGDQTMPMKKAKKAAPKKKAAKKKK